MNKILFLFFILTSFTLRVTAQQDSLIIKSDTPLLDSTSVKTDSIIKPKQNRHFFLGVDLYQPILTAFTDKTSGQAFASMKIKNNWHGIIEVGYESNTFDNLGWDVDAEGLFFRVGFNYFITKKPDVPDNGFYTGFRVAFSPYTQTVNQYPVRGFSDTDADGDGNLDILIETLGPILEESVSAFWIEPLAGARVQLFNTNFYADISGRLQVPITNSNSIDPLVVPGYGKDIGGINANILWGISYRF